MVSMEFMDVVKSRYSCRKFDGRPIAKEDLDAILEAGRLAPTAKNFQEQRIYVIQSPEGLAKVDNLTKCRYGAPTALLVAFNKDNTFTYPGGKYNSGIEDATIVTTHLVLGAKNVGVDSCWVNLVDPDAAAAAFGLPNNEEVLTFIMLGYAAEDAAPVPLHFSRKPIEETVVFL